MIKPLPMLMMLYLTMWCGPSCAQQSALRIGGVIKPTACTPQLAGESTFDLGSLHASELSHQSDPLERDLTLVITCDAPTRVGIKPQDNRAGSAARKLIRAGRTQRQADGGQQDDLFGLGMFGTTRLGGYEVLFVPGSFVADGEQVDTIAARPGRAGAHWDRGDAGRLRSGVVNAWARAGSVLPGAYSQITGMLRVRAMLAPRSELHVTDQMRVDGSLTLEMHYL